MILQKSFYFLRHGQTDHNIKKILTETEENPPLNAVGQSQAIAVASHVSMLEIDAICHSPLQRAVHTMQLSAAKTEVPMYHVDDLKECTSPIWLKMIALEQDEILPSNVKLFFDQVASGLNTALSYGESVLIVAHGGVHWALCHMLEITQHDWDLDNCGLVHFIPQLDGRWTAKLIN